MKNKILLISFFFALFFAFYVQAEIKTVSEELGGLTISRIAPDTTYVGQKIWITLVLENNSNNEKNIIVKENLGNADFDKTEVKNITTEYGDQFWYYEWKVRLTTEQKTTISYWLIPKIIGSYTISPSKLIIDGKNFTLKSWNIEVKCLANKKCDVTAGENYLNCSEDCPTGSKDSLCDSVQDGKCDPDCEKNADLDCEKSSRTSNLPYFFAGGIIIFLITIIIFKKKILKIKI